MASIEVYRRLRIQAARTRKSSGEERLVEKAHKCTRKMCPK